jgi:uncharacterized membrane protein
VAIAYPDETTARKAVVALHSLQDEVLIELEGAAWVTKARTAHCSCIRAPA